MHSPMVSDLDRVKEKILPSELHGKNRMFAFAVIDLVENIDVALQTAQLLVRQACRVDKSRLIVLEAGNKEVPVVLAVVKLHKMNDSLKKLRSQGIRIAAPCFHQDRERFLVDFCADALELRKGGIDADDASSAFSAFKADMKTGFLRRLVKLTRSLVLAVKIGTELCAGRQGCGVAGLHGK